MAIIAVRKMQGLDVGQVAEIEKAAFSTPWSEKSLNDSLQLDNYIFYVAYVGDEIVGYCGLCVVQDEGQITNVVVKRKYQNRGIATTLLKETMEEAKKRGAYNFTLEVRVSNQSAKVLYEKLGFVSVGVRKSFYTNPVEDASIMWLYTTRVQP